MAALANTNMNLADLTKMMGPDGAIEDTIEILNETNEVLDDMSWINGNLTTGHQHSVRTGLPSVTWGQLYKGVQPSKATRVQVTDNTGFMESLSETDVRLLELASDPMMARAVEDRPHVEALSQEFNQTLFKGTSADTTKFIGLEERFSDMSAANGDNIVDTGIGEDGDITSVWLIGWSPRTVFGIVPKNSTVGMKYEDAGADWVYDSSNGRYKILRSYWKWDCGLAMPDWRYVVRAQVDMSELTDDASSGIKLPFLFHDMMERLPSDAFGTTRLSFYSNRSVITKARKQAVSMTSSSTLELREVGAQNVASPRKKWFFDDIPFSRVDVLAADETVVA